MAEKFLPRDFPAGRLRRLRRLRPSDCEAFQAYRALPELGRYQDWMPMTEAEALEYLAHMGEAAVFTPGEWLQLGIAEPDSDCVVGDIGLYLSEDGGTGEVGFTLVPSAQGRGMATRAVREALDLLFSTTSVTKVLGITDARNHSSVRLLERLGFSRVETRKAEFRGESCTEWVYVLPRGT